MVEPNRTQENKSLLTFDIILPRFMKEVRSENTMKNNRTFNNYTSGKSREGCRKSQSQRMHQQVTLQPMN